MIIGVVADIWDYGTVIRFRIRFSERRKKKEIKK